MWLSLPPPLMSWCNGDWRAHSDLFWGWRFLLQGVAPTRRKPVTAHAIVATGYGIVTGTQKNAENTWLKSVTHFVIYVHISCCVYHFIIKFMLLAIIHVTFTYTLKRLTKIIKQKTQWQRRIRLRDFMWSKMSKLFNIQPFPEKFCQSLA